MRQARKLCKNGDMKWAQDGDMCRECWNGSHEYVGMKEREAERVARNEARLDRLRRPAYVPPERPTRVLRVGKELVEFEVVFDGR